MRGEKRESSRSIYGRFDPSYDARAEFSLIPFRREPPQVRAKVDNIPSLFHSRASSFALGQQWRDACARRRKEIREKEGKEREREE